MTVKTQELLAQLTLEEKISLLAGRNLWQTPAVSRLEVPSLKVTDGPNGARGADMSGSVTAACFPVGTALAATWDAELIYDVGCALGDETLSKRSQILLGPTVNLHRSPVAGRNFECYSEDPFLTGSIATAFIQGVQSRGVGCCIKHFVCNDSEFERHTISSEVDERTLREVYLQPFELAIRDAAPWAVMSAYNRLNGIYCSENEWLLTDVLRQDWGFDGIVMSDWFGTQSTSESVAAGLDLEMPGPPRLRGEKLQAAVDEGALDEKAIDHCVGRMLALLERSGRFESPEELDEVAQDQPEHRILVRRAAADGCVLLKNENTALPLDTGALERVAVIGPNAAVAHIHGGGSSRVAPHYEVSPLVGIESRCEGKVEVVFEPGCESHKTLPPLDGSGVRTLDEPDRSGFTVEFHNGSGFESDVALVRHPRRIDLTWLGEFSPEVDPTNFSARCRAHFTPRDSGLHSFGLVSAGLSRLFVDGELVVDNWTQQERGDSFFGVGSSEVQGQVELEAGRVVELTLEYDKNGAPIGGVRLGHLPPVPGDAMERAVAAARDADAAILVVGLNADWETEGRDREDILLPGRQVELIERVAAANPHTIVVLNCGAPVETGWIEHVPAALVVWYPGQEAGNAIAGVLFGDVNPSGHLPQTWPKQLEDHAAFANYPGSDGRVEYGEGLFIGYRHFEKNGIEPAFAFGHGLSYSSFEYGELRLSSDEIRVGEALEARVDVINDSDRTGREVVQLYVRDLVSSLERPIQELRGFAKFELEPGEAKTVCFKLDLRDFACWDPAKSDWVIETGDFELCVGPSSSDLRCRALIPVRGG